MTERLTVAAMIAADSRLDHTPAVVFGTSSGKREASVAGVYPGEGGRPGRVGRCANRAAVPRDRVAHERPQFLIRDLHEHRPDR